MFPMRSTPVLFSPPTLVFMSGLSNMPSNTRSSWLSWRYSASTSPATGAGVEGDSPHLVFQIDEFAAHNATEVSHLVSIVRLLFQIEKTMRS